MNNSIGERLGAQEFEYNAIYVSVDKTTQKIAVNLAENQSVFMIQSSDLKNCICRESHSVIKTHYLPLHRRSW